MADPNQYADPNKLYELLAGAQPPKPKTRDYWANMIQPDLQRPTDSGPVWQYDDPSTIDRSPPPVGDPEAGRLLAQQLEIFGGKMPGSSDGKMLDLKYPEPTLPTGRTMEEAYAAAKDPANDLSFFDNKNLRDYRAAQLGIDDSNRDARAAELEQDITQGPLQPRQIKDQDGNVMFTIPGNPGIGDKPMQRVGGTGSTSKWVPSPKPFAGGKELAAAVNPPMGPLDTSFIESAMAEADRQGLGKVDKYLPPLDGIPDAGEVAPPAGLDGKGPLEVAPEKLPPGTRLGNLPGKTAPDAPAVPTGPEAFTPKAKAPAPAGATPPATPPTPAGGMNPWALGGIAAGGLGAVGLLAYLLRNNKKKKPQARRRPALA